VPTGGAAGQVLTKLSVTDYDTNWQTPSGGALSWPLRGPADSVSAPNYSFAASISTGLYSPAANSWGLAANGVGVLTATSTQVTMPGSVLTKLGQGVALDTNPTSASGLIVQSGINTALTGSSQIGVNCTPFFSSASSISGTVLQVKYNSSAATWTTPNGYAIHVMLPAYGVGNSISTMYGLLIENQGTAAIGTVYGLYVQAQSGATTTNIGLYNAGTSQLMGTVGIGVAPQSYTGLIVQTASTTTGVQQYGILTNSTFSSAATDRGVGVFGAVITQAATFTMTGGYAFYAGGPSLGAGSAVTSSAGLYVQNQGKAGVTNAYGIYIENISGASSANYGLYNLGTSQFQGIVGIGAAPYAGSALAVYPPATMLTGTTQTAVDAEIVGSSAATNGIYGVYTQAGTAAATYTTVWLAGLWVGSPGPMGAGSTATNAAGLRVTNQGGAQRTNSYGIYIDAQSGASSSNWAIYAQGSSSFQRVYANQGTSSAPGNFVNSGWGTGTTFTPTVGSNDMRGVVTVTAGSSPTANPQWTYNFADGAFTTTPVVIVQYDSGTVVNCVVAGVTTTAFTVMWLSTPTASAGYTFRWITIA
jgi:hypothetical protein